MITTGRGLREAVSTYYHMRATGALHGAGAVLSSATCVPLIRANLAFGSSASAFAGLFRFRPCVLSPEVAYSACFPAFLASFSAFSVFCSAIFASFAASFVARSVCAILAQQICSAANEKLIRVLTCVKILN